MGIWKLHGRWSLGPKNWLFMHTDVVPCRRCDAMWQEARRNFHTYGQRLSLT
jgi:hypothetical protein